VDNIGRRLKEERQFRGWSQRDLARETGVNTDTISGIETGQHEPRPSTLRKLAEGLGIEVRDLFMEPALPKAEAPETGPPAKEASIFDQVRDAVLRQAEQDRQAFMRAVESGAEGFWMRHEAEAMENLRDRNQGDLAEAYYALMGRFLEAEREVNRLATEIEALRRQLEEVRTK
jgi:transcriptional regulator with XRE-family HTH domain